MTIHEIRVRSNKFIENLQSYIEGVVDDNQDLLNLNREQLLDGKKSSGKYMPAYSNRSVDEFNKPPGPIRLFDSGDFHGSFTIESKGSTFDIKGTDLYGLEDRFGMDIYGISKANQPKAKQITTKQLSEDYKKAVLNR